MMSRATPRGRALSFLPANRSIVTGDVDVDARAAASARDTIATLLVQDGEISYALHIAVTWLVTANVTRPLTDVGLNSSCVPTVTFDYRFGG